MKNHIDILCKSPLFIGIDKKDVKDILELLSGETKEYVKNEFIFTAGDPIHCIGIVISGSVSVINEDFWGNRDILSKVYPGEIFGEAFSCVNTQNIPVSVTANENSEILFINFTDILLDKFGASFVQQTLTINMLKILAEKNIILNQKINHVIKRTTRNKLLSYLSAQALKARTNTFHIPFNRQELADYLSVDRSAMSKELCRLRDEGVLSFRKNHFVLHRHDNYENIH